MAKLTIAQQEQLRQLIEQQTPNWCTKSIYDKLISDWKRYELTRDEFINNVLTIFSISYNSLDFNDEHQSVTIKISPSILFDRYNKGLIFSTPSTGQDPKSVDDEKNKKSAGIHAGRQWGSEKGSKWIHPGTFNLVQYPNGKLVLEPTDVEHRLWGLIGFPLDLIQLKSDKEDLFYYHSLIEGGKIRVNDLRLSEIVEKANQSLKPNADEKITEDDILKRYFRGLFRVTILPMYSEKDCHDYFTEINSSDEKTKAQFLHARNEFSNLSLKKFSSIKNERFLASNDELHPFYKHCFGEKSKIELDTLMISHLICQYIFEDDFVGTSDSPIYDYYNKPNGYRNNYDDELEMKCIDTLNSLYDIFKYRGKSNPSRQQILQILKLNNYIESEKLFIYDKEKFINEFYKFLDNHQTKDNPAGGKPIKLSFYTNMNSSDYGNLLDGHAYIKKHFLSNGDETLKYSKEILDDIGVMVVGSKIPRLFKQYVIDKSAKDYKGLDIDDKPFTEKPVGGHIISDFELSTLNDEQRSEAFLSEGLGSKFSHDKNCRAMSSYHNLRMSVLRLSEYMEIINESDEVVKEAVRNKKIKVKELIK
jgi:hypothetical protein